MSENNENKEKLNNNEKGEEKKEETTDDDVDDEIVIRGETLSNTRINITFPDMNESNIQREPRESVAFRYDTLDLDIPNFSPPRYKKSNWKIMHSCCLLLFCVFFAISVPFVIIKPFKTYHILLLLAHIFYVISTLVEWSYFNRGCIGDANLNSKLKSNIDQSFRAKVLRGESGLKYMICLFSSLILLAGDSIYFVTKSINLSIIETEIICDYFNIFGMMSIALAQIMKLEKMLNEDNKISYIEYDFLKSLFEIFFFFASLLDGGACIIHLFHMPIVQSPLKIFHLIIKSVSGILFLMSSIILLINYFCNDICKSKKKYRRAY